MTEIQRPVLWDDFQAILEENETVIVDFSRATGCIWCDRLRPVLERVAADTDDIAFVEVLMDELQEYDFDKFMKTYGIQGTPTVLRIVNGEVNAFMKERTYFKLKEEIRA